MTHVLRGLWNRKSFEWRLDSVLDLSERFEIQFCLPTERAFQSQEDALTFAAGIVATVPWCTPSDQMFWSVDFDALRQKLKVPLPEWIDGACNTVPVPRPVRLNPPRPGETLHPDALLVTCGFNPMSPEVADLVEAANRPEAIRESLARFRADYPDRSKVAFVMMRFTQTRVHEEIFQSIFATLERHGIAATRADGKEYHSNLFENVLTYIHGSRFGIAVFDRLIREDFNPNVSLEVGYMLAIRSPVCLLKDSTLQALHTDLLGHVYRSFDTQSPTSSIPAQLEAWMRDKDLTKR